MIRLNGVVKDGGSLGLGEVTVIGRPQFFAEIRMDCRRFGIRLAKT